jgi:Trk K+ transport system NAD-binding subunit
VEDVKVGPRTGYLDKPLGECKGLNDSKTLVFSMKRQGRFVFYPDPETRIQLGDSTVVIGFPENIVSLRRQLDDTDRQ